MLMNLRMRCFCLHRRYVVRTFAFSLFLGIALCSRAQMETGSLVPSDQVPQRATFFPLKAGRRSPMIGLQIARFTRLEMAVSL